MMYFVKSEQLSALCNVCSHIRNAFDGACTCLSTRCVWCSPISQSTPTSPTVASQSRSGIFVGEKNVCIVNMLPSVKIEKSAQIKDELSLVLTLM